MDYAELTYISCQLSVLQKTLDMIFDFFLKIFS